MILMVGAGSPAASAPGKCSQDSNRGIDADRHLLVIIPQVLKASFVHDLGGQDLGVGDLKSVLGARALVPLRFQGQLSNARVLVSIVKELVACCQRVVS